MALCLQPTISTILLGLLLASFGQQAADLAAANQTQQHLATDTLGLTAYSLQQDSAVLDNDDANCLEDRLEAVEIGRQCSRRCKKDSLCENARKQCLCDGLCGMSCLKPDLHCAELPKIEHGDYQPRGTRFNTKVTYQCESGFFLFGSRERLCQGDEDWSGSPAECLPEPQCRSPIKINHARNPSDGTYRLNDRVNYSCYPGYRSRGGSEAACKLIRKNQTAWVWGSGEPFRCLPKSCGDPGGLENGERHGDSFIIASSVLYSCKEGFEMIGQARRYCQSDNQWSGQAPQCEPVTCNPTDHLENGKINYAYPLVFNSTVEYSCDFGFKLIGPQVRRCGPERKLVGDVPTCKEIDCGELGPLNNGIIRGYSTRMGDRKEFQCNPGTKFVGTHNESTCLESSQWSHPLPKCLGSCVVPMIPFVHRVYVMETEMIERSKRNKSGIPLVAAEAGSVAGHGAYLAIQCAKNYEPDGRMDEHHHIGPPYCNNSSWSHEPRCKLESCRESPPTPRNGRTRVVSIEHGSKGLIYCIEGFKLQGDNTTTCNKGNWSRVNSTCAEVFCSFPGRIEHGRVLLVGLTGMYDYQPYIKRISTNRQIAYECNSGFRLNDGAPGGATCMDGRWWPEGLPQCLNDTLAS